MYSGVDYNILCNGWRIFLISFTEERHYGKIWLREQEIGKEFKSNSIYLDFTYYYYTYRAVNLDSQLQLSSQNKNVLQ